MNNKLTAFFIVFLLFISLVSKAQLPKAIYIYEKDSVLTYDVNYNNPDTLKQHKITGYYTNEHDKKAVIKRYKNGTPNGKEVIYFKNGKKSIVKNYKNGKLNGTWKMHYESGKILCRGKYKYGERSGLWKEYAKGRLICSTYYINGKQVRSTFLHHKFTH